MKNRICIFLVLILASCSTDKMNKNIIYIDVQGHRGCRGLLPENTIDAFMKALELGVTTLEMDLVISKDKQVVVSHEPFFNHEISTDPDGLEITADQQLEHNIYKLDYEDIQTYDVGLKPHSKFPEQKSQKAFKPLFKDVVAAAEAKAKILNRPLPLYNVEIKRTPKGDDEYHPDAIEFAQLVVSAVQKTGIKDRIYIQSFDIESLQVAKKLDSTIKLVLLIQNMDSPESNIEKLGFTPEVYSPYFKLVNTDLVSLCKKRGIKLIPWTVNEVEDLNKMIMIGVDGIITDYPNRLVEVLSTNDKYAILK